MNTYFVLQNVCLERRVPRTEWCYCSISFPRDTIWGIKDALRVFAPGRELWCVDGGEGKQRFDPEEWYKSQSQDHAVTHFATMEARLVLCALLADVPVETIGAHTDSYLDMMREFQKDFDKHRRAEMDYVESHIKLKEMESQASDAHAYKDVLKNPDHDKYVKQLKEAGDMREKYYPQKYRSPPYRMWSF